MWLAPSAEKHSSVSYLPEHLSAIAELWETGTPQPTEPENVRGVGIASSEQEGFDIRGLASDPGRSTHAREAELIGGRSSSELRAACNRSVL